MLRVEGFRLTLSSVVAYIFIELKVRRGDTPLPPACPSAQGPTPPHLKDAP